MINLWLLLCFAYGKFRNWVLKNLLIPFIFFGTENLKKIGFFRENTTLGF